MNINPLIVLAVVGVLIVIFGIYVLLHRRQRLGKNEQKKVERLWKELFELSDDHPDQAIMKADKLLDYALTKAGYSGTLADKLKKARSVFRDNNGLWSAHKLRNHLAHEVDAKLTPSQAKFALKSFRKALVDLGIKL